VWSGTGGVGGAWPGAVKKNSGSVKHCRWAALDAAGLTGSCHQVPGGTGLLFSSALACCTERETAKGVPGAALPNCRMIRVLPAVVPPIGCHRQGGGATGNWTWVAAVPTSPLSMIRLLSRTEQVLPVQPTPDPARTGAAIQQDARKPARARMAAADRRIM